MIEMREFKQTVKVSRIILGLLMTFGMITGMAAPAFAEYGGGSAQSYTVDTPLDNGTIVQLDKTDGKKVKIATQEELENMFGVTVDRTQLLVSSSSGTGKEVFVAVSGTYNVLVSDEGGEINVGDYVTMSAINGITMKAGTEQKTVFGRAAGAFDGKGVTLGTTTLKDTTGATKKTVTFGLIPVAINIQHNPNKKSTKVEVPDFLERIGEAVAEKEVSPVRIYLSMAITAVSIIAAIAILYAGIRNSIISIGRNPMSKKTIFRALIQIILTSILILIIGLFAVYLLLKL